MSEEDEAPCCGQPCDPYEACESCQIYWDRMRDEGYWDPESHQWTDKGWREIVRA